MMTQDENFTKSETFKNLLTAFAGESQAHTKYQYYASKAKKDGFVQIANIFEETSKNEKEHAKIWFKLLYNSIGDTIDNLKDAIEGETYEHDVMYADFAKKAYEEGYNHIGDLFSKVGDIEEHHAQRYDKLFNKVQNDTIFHKNIPTKWKCNNCGYIVFKENAPDVCPVCNHPKAYFERLCELY